MSVLLGIPGEVAQWIEQPPSKRSVVGSSPAFPVLRSNFQLL